MSCVRAELSANARCKSNGRPLTSEPAHETVVLRLGPSLFANTQYSIVKVKVKIIYFSGTQCIQQENQHDVHI